MATIQCYPEELDYVNATLRLGGQSNSFVVTFCNACLRADGQNYEVCRPVLHFLMGKYPARAELLEREHRDRARAPESGT
jgi:hypothetical protein